LETDTECFAPSSTRSAFWHAERFKIVTGSNGAGGIATSSDGIHWSTMKDLQKETHARWDTPKNLVWDRDRRQWIIYVRSAPTIQEAEAGSLRVQSYVHSLTEDFMGNWSVVRKPSSFLLLLFFWGGAFCTEIHRFTNTGSGQT
jgi:hypothetical protein